MRVGIIICAGYLFFGAMVEQKRITDLMQHIPILFEKSKHNILVYLLIFITLRPCKNEFNKAKIAFQLIFSFVCS